MGRPVEIEVGQRYGMLEVLARSEPNKCLQYQRPHWLCQCECGKQKVVSGQFLKRSHNPSCGCMSKGVIKNRKYDDPKEVTINSVLANYKTNAKRRGFNWTLSREQFKQLALQACYYCKIKPHKIQNVYARRHSERHRVSQEWSERAAIKLNGIDRQNNTKGYTPKNCVPCCEICNKAKRNLTHDEFMSWINQLITAFEGV